MKKLLLLTFLLAVVPHAYAQSDTAAPVITPQVSNTCDPACTSSQTCYSGVCLDNDPTSPSTSNVGNTNDSTGFVPLAPIPGLDANGASAGASGLAQFLNNLYKYLIGLAAILAVIQIIRGGLEYATQDSVSKKGDGRKHIEQAILGLVLVLSPVLVFSIINPQILNLSLNLPALNTANGNASAGSTSGSNLNQAPNNNPGSGTPAANGCNTPTGGSEYQAVSCSTDAAAQDWLSANCSTYGTLTAGVCQQLNSQQQCTTGNYPQISCPKASSRLFTFVDEGSNNSVFNLSNHSLRAIDADKNVVEGFVSACSQSVCFVSGGVSKVGACVPGSYSFNTSGGSAPNCYTGTLLCYAPSADAQRCDSVFQIDATP